MGSFRFPKSVKLGPGVRLNVTKRGLGVSGGVRGARVSYHSSGRRTTSVGVPDTGLGYVQTKSGGRGRTAGGEAAPAVDLSVMPKAGMFAPKHEKRFAKAMQFLLVDDRETALRGYGYTEGIGFTKRGANPNELPNFEALFELDHGVTGPEHLGADPGLVTQSHKRNDEGRPRGRPSRSAAVRA